MDDTEPKEEPSNGSELQKGKRVPSNVFAVAIDVTQDLSLRAAEWALEHKTQKGDRLILLGVLEDAGPNPPKEKLGLENETNDRTMLDEAVRKKSEIEKNITSFEANCRKKGVMLEIQVTVGIATLIVVEGVIAWHATSLVLDRNLKVKKENDIKFIQNAVSCRIYQMKNDFEADIIQDCDPDVEIERCFMSASLSDEDSGGETTSASRGLESDDFSISCEETSLQSGSRMGRTKGAQKFIPYSERSFLPRNFPRSISHSSLTSLNCSIEIPSQTDDFFQNAACCFSSSKSQPVKSSTLSTSTSPSNSHSAVKSSISRSVSDSSFDKQSPKETVPISVQPGRISEALALQSLLDLNEQYKRKWEQSNTCLGTSLDVSNQTFQPNLTSSDHGSNMKDEIPSSNKPLQLAENHQLQQQTGPQKEYRQEMIELQWKKFQPMKNPSHNHSLMSNSFSQGRSLLCSICKQKSPQFGSLPRRFSLAELQAATRNFSNDNFLAEGGFGFVHKGYLNGQYIAVKWHKLASTQGYKEFRSEVELLSCAQHRNLVMLLGYCDENGHRMLVYEYVCNKSLDWHLSCNNSTVLGWSARWKIALGTARALRYLHEECRAGCIVHRDMRPNNILLTHEFQPMVGDFGLARSHPEGEHAIETRIIGTFGYLSPEYAETGQVSWKADVYAYGVVLLELITGRKALDLLQPSGQQSLTEWARPKLLNDAMFHLLVDRSLENYNVIEVRAMMSAAYQCIKKDPLARPKMREVLHFLEGANKDWDETLGQMMDLSFARQDKVQEPNSEMQFSLTHHSVSVQKSQARKLLVGNSNRGKQKLSYITML